MKIILYICGGKIFNAMYVLDSQLSIDLFRCFILMLYLMYCASRCLRLNGFVVERYIDLVHFKTKQITFLWAIYLI